MIFRDHAVALLNVKKYLKRQAFKVFRKTNSGSSVELEPELVPSTLTAQIWKDRTSVGERLAETMNRLGVNQMNKYVEASFYPLAKKPQ